VDRALTRDARLPGKARPFDREAEMRFAAAVVPRMAMMLRAVVAESEGSTRKSSGKQPLHFALHWTFFAHAPMLGTKAQHDKPPTQPIPRPRSARSRLRRSGLPRTRRVSRAPLAPSLARRPAALALALPRPC